MSVTQAWSLRGLALAAAIVITGCTPTSTEVKPLKFEDTTEITATVMSIDQTKRLMELKGEKTGEVGTVQVSPVVRNLAQVKVGDRVVVRYYQALGAEIQKPDAPAGEGTIQLSGARADEGERPAAAL